MMSLAPSTPIVVGTPTPRRHADDALDEVSTFQLPSPEAFGEAMAVGHGALSPVVVGEDDR